MNELIFDVVGGDESMRREVREKVCDVMVGLEEEKFGKRRRKLPQPNLQHTKQKKRTTNTNQPPFFITLSFLFILNLQFSPKK